MARILFLAHRLPYPPDKGDKIRSWNMLRHLCAAHEVHLGCCVDDPADMAHVPALRRVCASVAAFPLRARAVRMVAGLVRGQALSVAAYEDAGLAAWVRERQGMDVAFAFSGAMAPYALGAGAARTVLDLVDVDSLKWRDYASRARGARRWVYAREARRLLAFERSVAARADLSLFVSAAEEAAFHRAAPELGGRTGWVGMGVDHAFFDPAGQPNPFAPGELPVVFTGQMGYWPNVDAVQWFAREVLPGLRARFPLAALHVVGASPNAAVRALAGDGHVRVTGRVADVRPYLAHAALVVAPLRVARGIQSKVLEAMAMGRPVLASPEALEGIDAVPGQDLLVARTGAEMLEAAAAVLGGGHKGLGGAARAAVLRAYGWPGMLAQLDAALGLQAAQLRVAS